MTDTLLEIIAYQGTFTDKFGCEPIIVVNDGREMRARIRGVDFSSTSFDDLTPAHDAPVEHYARFNFAHAPRFHVVEENGLLGAAWTREKRDQLHDEGKVITAENLKRFSYHLCSYELALVMPVPVVVENQEFIGMLHMELTLGAPTSNGGLDEEKLRLKLVCFEREYFSSGTKGYFEDELNDIQRQLSADTFIKACINCLYSDYSIFGMGLFGSMMCYRNMKAAYLAARSKNDHMEVYKRCDIQVQETYLCPEFTRRIPGTGYRG
jgi:hypothetical protein